MVWWVMLLIRFAIMVIMGLFSQLSLAEEFCVATAAELQNALTTAQDNGEDDTVQIVQGSFAGNYAHISSENYALSILGGFDEECNSRVTDPGSTILDGNHVGRTIALVGASNIVDFYLDGVTIKNGKILKDSGEGGGASIVTDGVATVTNNHFINNSTLIDGFLNYSGALKVSGNSVVLTDNYFSGNYSDHGVISVSGESTISNNIIEDNFSCGLIIARDSPAIITKNTIARNNGLVCGGISLSSSATLTGNTVSNNTSSHSTGGIRVPPGHYANFILNNNIINGNKVTPRAKTNGSGGVFIYGSSMSMSGNAIYDNEITTSYGEDATSGGVLVLDGDIYMENNIISNNSVSGHSANNTYAGGILAIQSSGTLISNVIAGNISSENGDTNGGGVYIVNERNKSKIQFSVINNTISNNSSALGGGVSVRLYNNESSAEIINNIIWGNSSTGIGNDVFIDNDGNDDYILSPVTLNNNDFDQSMDGYYAGRDLDIDLSNMNNVDPFFLDLDNGDFRLTELSPLIDQGDSTIIDNEHKDLDGKNRILGYSVDIGAYEYGEQLPSPLLDIVSPVSNSIFLVDDNDKLLIVEVDVNIVNFTTGIDGYWSYSINNDAAGVIVEYADSTAIPLPVGEHTIAISLVDNNNQAIDPVVEQSIIVTILLDSDSDGVSDASDLFPENPLYSQDSDNDSLPDEWETNRVGNLESSRDSDSDNDGITNFDEFRNGTDPLVTTSNVYSQADLDAAIQNAAMDCEKNSTHILDTTQSYTYALSEGWNMIGGKDASDTASIRAFMEEHSADSIFNWDSQWKSHIKDTPDFLNSLTNMDASKGYFVHIPPEE
jgi:hypothetical protein